MPGSNNYLDFHAQKGTGFLHPGGAALTGLLIKELASVKNMKVLEVGCGTGATVVRLTKNYQTKSTAVDFSEKMLQAAKQRAWWNGVLKQIDFKKIDGDGLLPFPDNSFEAVYCESVLAIVKEHILPPLLKEISRVLVPGGKFISNDAIWKEGSSFADIEKINSACLRDFGMVQSIASPAFKNDWVKLFEQSGFSVCQVSLTSEAVQSLLFKKKIDWFNIYKTFLSYLNPFMLYKQQQYRQSLKFSHLHDRDFIESYLFVTKNKK